MSGWSAERREAQRERARTLVAEGKFGGPGRGQGRKRKPRLALSWEITCPSCGHTLQGRASEDIRAAEPLPLADEHARPSLAPGSIVVHRDGSTITY